MKNKSQTTQLDGIEEAVVVETRVTLLNAQIMYIQALYDYQVSYIRL